MKTKRTIGNKGFTLLELMIATIVFSVILLASTTIVLQISRMYYKGVVTNRTQETTRRITDEIAQQIQFGGGEIITSPPNASRAFVDGALTVQAFCIGNQRYSYAVNAKVTSSTPAGTYNPSAGHQLQHGLWRDTIASGGACTPLDLSQPTPPGSSADGQELLGQNMRLSDKFSLACLGSRGVCNLTVSVLYGDDDLLVTWPNPTRCGNVTGSQWCAASTINTQIFKRLQQAGL